LTRLAAALAVLLTLMTAAPALAEPAGADLTVFVTFDKSEYLSYETVMVTYVVANTGTAAAHGVTLTYDTNGPFEPVQWPNFDPANGGTTVEAGERVEWTLYVDSQHFREDVMRLALQVHTPDAETDLTNNAASVEATFTYRTADLVGTLYGDRDGDHVFDPGEAMVGVEIRGIGGPPDSAFSARTDENGRFVVKDLPEGTYPLDLRLRGGWQPDESNVVSVRVGGPPALVRAVLSSTDLRSSITFDKTTYQVGETLREHVTLTNTGRTDLAGVTARCVEGAAPNQLSGLGWGDLVHDEGAGVSVRAGETRTWEFTDIVPPGGYLYGFITITCWFSTAFRYDDGPTVLARAEVPGGRGTAGGYLYVDRDSSDSYTLDEAAAGVKLCLVDKDGRVVARTTSDAKGYFVFRDLPANRYPVRLVGPWRAKNGIDLELGVFTDAVIDSIHYAIEPGANQPDPDEQTSTNVPRPPVPQASPTPAAHPASLADTGADVADLIRLGLLLLLAGGGLLLGVRRPGEAP
jgi:hypothetical protein